MTQQRKPKPVDELVFYVDEEGDDYTFYLARDTENTVFSKFAWATAREHLRFGPSKVRPEEEFSFAEKITVKRLDEIKSSFWRGLKNAKHGSPGKYLLKAMRKLATKKGQSTIESDKTIRKEASAILNNLTAGKHLRRGDKQMLRPFLTLALNTFIHQDNLARRSSFASVLKKLAIKEAKFPNPFVDEQQQRQWRNLGLIELAFPALKRRQEDGRALLCFSHAGKYLSVTVRTLKEDSGYKAHFLRNKEKDKRKQYVFSRGEYCKHISEQIFGKKQSSKRAHGLIVVTGSTNSLKSEIARGLIDLYLTNRKHVGRRHHLVTFEDPIEKKLYPDQDVAAHPYVAVSLSQSPDDINYTPRQKQKDVRFLKDALADALRQTPALFFVGETRDKEEWEVLLDFAATGHLIVTTAHAGSLVEAMHKIFEALNVKTPADRNEIANKLLAVIHLRAGALIFEPKKAREPADHKRSTNALFPALWRRTPLGIAALTCDGLASLLPYRPTKENRANRTSGHGSPVGVKSDHNNNEDNDDGMKSTGSEDSASCLGRRWFIEQLMEDRPTNKQLKTVFRKNLKYLTTQAYWKATEWDLQGV